MTVAVATPAYLLGGSTAHPNGSSTPPSSAVTPAELRSAYGFNNISFSGNGAGQTIAIVDAYDDPNIASDLTSYDNTYGITSPAGFTLTKMGATTSGALTSTLPAAAGNSGWDVETSLDVELAHSLAPAANILLVEASSDSYTDLFNAVAAAKTNSAVSVVSMSWGGSEFSGESSYDSLFTSPSSTHHITFVASTGDSGAPAGYPAYSPNVLAVGGTTLNQSNGTYSSETAWSDSGGGISTQESQPSYQSGVVTQSTTKRTTPDVSFDANPSTGVAVLDTYSEGGWIQVGGTSMAAPSWAALIAVADQGRVAAGEGTLDGATQTLPELYSLESSTRTSSTPAFHDITSGSNGYSAGVGYDLVTGLGSPVANLVVSGLVGSSSTSGGGSSGGSSGGGSSGGSSGGGSSGGGSSGGGSGTSTTFSDNSGEIIEGGYESWTTVNVSSPYQISSLQVQVNVSYGRDSDLGLYLESPSGKVYDLSLENGGNGANYSGTIFSSSASTSINNGRAPFSGTYAPDSSLNGLTGGNAQGTWYFIVVDYGSRRSIGTINSWSLTVTGTPGTALRVKDTVTGLESQGITALPMNTVILASAPATVTVVPGVDLANPVSRSDAVFSTANMGQTSAAVSPLSLLGGSEDPEVSPEDADILFSNFDGQFVG